MTSTSKVSAVVLSFLLIHVAFGQNKGEKGDPGDAAPGPRGGRGEPGPPGFSGCDIVDKEIIERGDRFVRPCTQGVNGYDQSVDSETLVRVVFEEEWKRHSDLEFPPDWYEFEGGAEIPQEIELDRGFNNYESEVPDFNPNLQA